MFSLVIPVYRNEASIPDLVNVLESLAEKMSGDFEAVFVIDGSPDRSAQVLGDLLPQASFPSQIVILSRNFGSFSALKAGLACAKGDLFSVMSADLQEPPELILSFREKLLTGNYDIVVGSREGRNDPFLSRITAKTFWWLYRTLAQKEIPPGGVDIFGCTKDFRDHLLALEERNSTMVGLIFWLGFRRCEVLYTRKARLHGKSAWSFARKFRYLLDSIFAFSDLPIRIFSVAGITGILFVVLFAPIVLYAKWTEAIPVPGYATTILAIMFFSGLNLLGLGVIGEYIWRTFENTKKRPDYIIQTKRFLQKKDTQT